MQIEGVKDMVVGGASGMARATAERIAAGGGTVAIIENPMINGGCIRLDAGQRFAPK